MTPAELSVMFFLQMAAIIAACRIVGWAAKRFLGQPQVVGEMIAGVMLGPSLLGLAAPDVSAWLFPPESRGLLFVVAQLGVGLYMFIVGLGFDLTHFRANARSAAAVSLSGIAAPFLLAVMITPWVLKTPGLFSADVPAPQATLFMGACIAITAFPMLARIIHERGLSRSPLGTLALSAGAIDDAGAWIVLAIVLASLGAGAGVAIIAICSAIAFVLFMVTIGHRLLARLGRIAEREGKISDTTLALALGAFMLSAFAMDFAGLHAVFGGFVLGAAMPRGFFADELRKRLEPFVVTVLLPVFFCYSGLNTHLTMVNNAGLLLIAGVILLASIAGKGLACYLAARATGQSNATALGIGALMNARGLMELIIINIGLQRGVIEAPLFAMLVMMAVVTTLMASPLFELAYGARARASGVLAPIPLDTAPRRP
ncbi:MAG: cation:proton antiporter [Hyphomonadaceae bacterium]|nr:cation:proton antiporter [Hyphomonadaceae bacterium]